VKIGVDIYGGDYAPEAVVLGCILAYKELPLEVRLVLIGDEKLAQDICRNKGIDPFVFEYVHTLDSIGMGEHPAKAFQSKPKSSISLGFSLLKQGIIDGFASAGNTGAMMVGSYYTVKLIPGVIRPVITAAIPRETGAPVILLDVGINPDAKPDVLYQYGILGSIYAQFVFGINSPKVGLMNIGSEEDKGNLVSKATYQLMQETNEFNFIGNIEGNDLFTGKADVAVADGFVGNVMLKQAESFYALVKKRNIQDEFFEKFNFENYGGTPVLGINSPVIIGHGRSNDVAVKNMILHTQHVVNADICNKFKEVFNK
jgi:phosphate acyltransferase